MLHSTTAIDFDLFSLAVVLKGKEGDGSVAGEDGLIAPRREEEAVCCARSPQIHEQRSRAATSELGAIATILAKKACDAWVPCNGDGERVWQAGPTS